MWTTIIIGVLLLAGFGLYADLPRGHAAYRGRGVDETPAHKEEREETPSYSYSQVDDDDGISDENEDSVLDPDID